MIVIIKQYTKILLISLFWSFLFTTTKSIETIKGPTLPPMPPVHELIVNEPTAELCACSFQNMITPNCVNKHEHCCEVCVFGYLCTRQLHYNCCVEPCKDFHDDNATIQWFGCLICCPCCALLCLDSASDQWPEAEKNVRDYTDSYKKWIGLFSFRPSAFLYND